MEPALSMHGYMIGWRARLADPVDGGFRRSWHEKGRNQGLLQQHTRQGCNEKVTSSGMYADQNNRHLLFPITCTHEVAVTLSQFSMLPLS